MYRMNEQYQQAHEEARRRFLLDPSKCYQRHIREVWAEHESRPQLASLKGALVRTLSFPQAEDLILRYEWLAGKPGVKSPMGKAASAFYGLFLNDELLGANVLGMLGGQYRKEAGSHGGGAGNICGKYLKKTVCLMRGACVPHAPRNAASFLTRYTCSLANREHGWKVFFAYSDVEANEIGTIYQACNWFYLGQGLGSGKHIDYERTPRVKKTWFQADKITSYELNHHSAKVHEYIEDLGWDGTKGEKRQTLVINGWTPRYSEPKHKWAWFEGTPEEKSKMMNACRTHLNIKKKDWPLPYPKRTTDV